MPAETGVDHFDSGIGINLLKCDAEHIGIGPLSAGVVVDAGNTVSEADNFDGALSRIESIPNVYKRGSLSEKERGEESLRRKEKEEWSLHLI
jgi:ligand-binding sensor protein